MLLNILAVGDVVGEGGQDILSRRLRDLKDEHKVHFTVVNGENCSGVGILPRQAQRLFDAVLTDLDNGAGEYAPMTADELPWCTVYLELDDGQNTYWFDSIKPDFTETVKVLVSLGLEEEQIFQWEDNEKYGW